MPIKIENSSSRKLPKRTEEVILSALDCVPKAHLRGLERIRLVDYIGDPRIPVQNRSALPGLYHPRQGNQAAWMEVACGVIIPQAVPFYKRLFQQLSFKSNLAAIILSMAGQHYHLTLRHSVKKGQLEGLVRAYVETYMHEWAAKQNTLRYRIFRPFQPALERWAKKLQKRAKEGKTK